MGKTNRCVVKMFATYQMKTSDQQSRTYTLFVSNNFCVNFLSGISTKKRERIVSQGKQASLLAIFVEYW